MAESTEIRLEDLYLIIGELYVANRLLRNEPAATTQGEEGENDSEGDAERVES